jgi:uncharacterized delta-60 repeat protein
MRIAGKIGRRRGASTMRRRLARWVGVVLLGLVVGMFGVRGARAQDPGEVLVPEGEPASVLEGADWARMGWVLSVAYSPDGKAIATGTEDSMVRLWDVASGREIRRFTGNIAELFSVAFSPDGRFLASGSLDTTVDLWEVASGRLLYTLMGHSDLVRSVAFSPDGKLLASGSADKTMRLWDVTARRLLYTFEGHTDPVSSVAFSPDGKFLASGSVDKTMRLWDVTARRLLYTFEGHTEPVGSVAFSPDGKLLASGSVDKTIHVWDVASRRSLHTFEGHISPVSSVAFSPDGKLLASGSMDKTMRIWEMASGHSLHTFEGHTSSVSSVAFSPDGRFLVSGSEDKTARLWDMASGRSIRTFKGHVSSATVIALSRDGKFLAWGSDDGAIRLWDVPSGRPLSTFQGHLGRVTSIAFSPDGKLLLSGSDDRTVRLWDVASGRPLLILTGHLNTVSSVAFSPDGKLLASGGLDNAVRLWDTASGRPMRTLEGHAASVDSVTFSMDGKLLASGSADRTVRLWDVASGQPVHKFVGHAERITSVAFSPDGKLFASGATDKTVHLRDVTSGRTIMIFGGHTASVASVMFTPDSKVLASVAADNTVRLWDVASGNPLQTFEGPTMSLTSVAFSLDGGLLASGSADGALRLRSLHDPTSPVRTVRVAPAGWLDTSLDGRVFRHDDGRFLYTNRNGTVTPVLPPKPTRPPELHLFPHDVTNPGDGPDRDPDASEKRLLAHLTLTVTNAPTAGRAYWLRVEAVDPPPGLVLLPPSTHLLLEPNQSVELPVDLSWVSPSNPPVPRPKTALRVRIVHASGESAPIDIPLDLRAPVIDFRGTPRVDAESVQVFLVNNGDQATGPLQILSFFEIAGSEDPAEFRQTVKDIPPQWVTNFAVPIPPAARKAGRFSLRVEAASDLTAQWVRVPPRIWTLRRDVRVPLPALVYTAAVLAAVLLAAALVYFRIYRHPMVVRVATTPGALKLFALTDLPTADRALRRARRLKPSLSVAVLPPARWQRALAPDRIQAFSEALGATPGSPIANTPPNPRALDITLPGLRLRFAQQTTLAIVEGRDLEAGAAARLAAAIHRNGAGPRQALVLDLTETQQARARLLETPSVAFVVLTADRLRDLLLADRPAEVLEATLVEQLKVADLSPYQTAGGVEQEALFFGRERELRTMADRTLRNFLLVGPRQMGKSTLLKALERRVRQRDDVEAHYVTLADGDVTAHLAHHLQPDANAGDSSIDRFRALAAGAPGKPRLWLLDEADRFVEDDARRDHAVTRTMRALSQDGRAYFVLTGYWHLYAATVLDKDHPLLNFAEVMRLAPLDEEDARALATEPMAALGLRWDEASTVDHLIQGTGRRANLIVLACKAMIESLGPEDRVLTRERLGAVLARRDTDLAAALLVWRAYDLLDRILVAQSFLLGEPTPDDVRAALKKRAVAASGVEIEQAFERLMLGYLLLRDDDGRLRCPVPFMREAIERERKLDDRLQDDLDDWAATRRKAAGDLS